MTDADGVSAMPSESAGSGDSIAAESARGEALRATESVVQSFREMLFLRAGRHSDTLATTYREVAEQMRKSLYELQEQITAHLSTNQSEVLQEIEQKLQMLRTEAAAIGHDASKIRMDLDKAVRELDAALKGWNDAHSSTFKALERFQREYRTSIDQFEKASARTEKIVEGLQGFKNLSLPAIFAAAVLGTFAAELLAHLGGF
jgi:gas vesicle protein